MVEHFNYSGTAPAGPRRRPWRGPKNATRGRTEISHRNGLGEEGGGWGPAFKRGGSSCTPRHGGHPRRGVAPPPPTHPPPLPSTTRRGMPQHLPHGECTCITNALYGPRLPGLAGISLVQCLVQRHAARCPSPWLLLHSVVLHTVVDQGVGHPWAVWAKWTESVDIESSGGA